MRAMLLAIALIATALAGCAGLPDEVEHGDSGLSSPSQPPEMGDLEPAGPFDADLENDPGE